MFILDDSEPFLKLLSFMIRVRLGLDSVLSSSFSEAKEKVISVQDSIFVAILDLNLPDSTGYEHIDFFLSLGIPCIVLTGEFDSHIRDTVFSQKNIIDYALKTRKEDVDYVLYLLGRLQKNRYVQIIVVDDSPTQRAFCADLLRMQMFDVLEAQNGLECLEILEKNKTIKMVITDYEMPGMDGFELTSEIRSKYTREVLAVIGLASGHVKNVSSRFIKIGVNDYLGKPFTKEEFFCRINMNLESLENWQKMRDIANHDFLTGLKNRGHFFETANQMLNEEYQILVFGMIDIDHFKKINDTYGHEAGDHCLKHLASELKLSFNEFGSCGRMGGEEFAVILKDTTFDQASLIFENLRKKIEENVLNYEKEKIKFTISSGVCLYSQVESLDLSLRYADSLLYQSKQTGRNKVTIGNFIKKNDDQK